MTAPDRPGEAVAIIDGSAVAEEPDLDRYLALIHDVAGVPTRPRSNRVLIVGANTMPLLSPLLMVAGIGDITIWSMKDARQGSRARCRQQRTIHPYRDPAMTAPTHARGHDRVGGCSRAAALALIAAISRRSPRSTWSPRQPCFRRR